MVDQNYKLPGCLISDGLRSACLLIIACVGLGAVAQEVGDAAINFDLNLGPSQGRAVVDELAHVEPQLHKTRYAESRSEKVWRVEPVKAFDIDSAFVWEYANYQVRLTKAGLHYTHSF